MARSKGQTLIDAMEGFIRRYVNMPDEMSGQALVMALWCLHTWLYERFSVTPYLNITAATKQAGKTVCMEVLDCLCRGGMQLATLRPLMMVRAIAAHEGRITLFIDEAEKLSSGAIGDLRSIFTTGYAKNGQHGITVGKSYMLFSTFAPKCFALIGDTMDVVRDRSIVITLERGRPSEDFRGNRDIAEIEADQIKADMRSGVVADTPRVVPSFLEDREREIWTPIYSVACALHLDRPTMDRLERAMVDLVQAKRLPPKRFYSADAEAAAEQARYGERAVRDLLAVFDPTETDVTTDVVVERLRAIPTGPWRAYKGEGLSVLSLAALVRPFGIQARYKRVGGRGSKQVRVYSRDSVVNAQAKVLEVAR